MILAWKVVLEDRHIDTQVAIFLSRGDAISYAERNKAEWLTSYNDEVETYDEIHGDNEFYFSVDDGFSVSVSPTTIYEPGEPPLEIMG